MGPTVGGVVAGLLLAAAVLGPLERLRPALKGQRVLRHAQIAAAIEWFFTPLVTRALTRAAVVAAVVLV